MDAGLAGGYSSGIEAGGFGGLVEPKLMLHDNITVGVRLEGLVTFGASVNRGSDDLSLDSGSVAATLAKAEYLLGDLAIRPVVGLGVGMYSIGGETITTGDDVGVSQRAGRYFGVAPQLGIELGLASQRPSASLSARASRSSRPSATPTPGATSLRTTTRSRCRFTSAEPS